MLCSAALLLNGCGRWVVQATPVATLVADHQPGKIRMEWGEGEHRRLTRPQVVGDSIRGSERGAVAIADVTAVSTWKSDPARTVVAALGVGLLAVTMVGVLGWAMSPPALWPAVR